MSFSYTHFKELYAEINEHLSFMFFYRFINLSPGQNEIKVNSIKLYISSFSIYSKFERINVQMRCIAFCYEIFEIKCKNEYSQVFKKKSKLSIL